MFPLLGWFKGGGGGGGGGDLPIGKGIDWQQKPHFEIFKGHSSVDVREELFTSLVERTFVRWKLFFISLGMNLSIVETVLTENSG